MQGAAQPQTFRVYPTDHRPTHNTATAISSEERVGNIVYQVFSRRGEPKSQLFRVQVGEYVGGKLVKTWNYGIETEADFDGDGQPDYVWYGGDDTTESIVLFMSSGGHYDRTDVIRTAAAAWEHDFKRRAPDLAALDGEYGVASVVVERSNAHLTLVVGLGQRFNASKKGAKVFRISQRDFKP